MPDDPTPDAPAQDPPKVDPPAPTPDPEPVDTTDWKAQARKWEERAKSNTAAAKRLEELEAASQTELEKAQKAAEDNAARATVATQRAVRAEVKSLADGFADKEDAVLNLGELTRFVNDDGEIDEKAIGKALKDVLERKPHLAKTEPKPEPSKPGRRPTETLRPGAAPAEPERATNLYDAIAGHYQT